MILADIALKEGIIVGVGDFSASSAEQVIDATGCYVILDLLMSIIIQTHIGNYFRSQNLRGCFVRE